MKKIITLDNKDYIIVKEVEFNNNNYIYATADDESDKLVLLRESEENGQTFVESVTDEKEFIEVMKLIAG